jgi:hypothetical protein
VDEDTKRSGDLLAGIAITVEIKGMDVKGGPFVESTSAFPVSRGVAVLDTIHDVANGATLEITQVPSDRTTIGRVKSLGPKLGPRMRILVELEDATYLWWGGFPDAADRRKRSLFESSGMPHPAPPPAPPASVPATVEGDPGLVADVLKALEPQESPITAPAETPAYMELSAHIEQEETESLPEIRQDLPSHPTHATEQPVTTTAPFETPKMTATIPPAVSDRFTDMLSEMVKVALEANLQPAADHAAREFEQRLEQTRDLARVGLEKLSQDIFREMADRLRAEAVAASSNVEEVLRPRIQDLVEKAGQTVHSRHEQFAVDLEKELAENQERLRAQAAEIVDAAAGGLRRGAEEQLAGLSQRFGEQCQQTADSLLAGQLEAAGNSLVHRIQQADSEFAERLTRHSEKEASHFSGVIEKHVQEGLSAYAMGLQSQLDEVSSQLSDRSQQVQSELTARLSQRAEDAASHFSAEVDERLRKALDEYSAGLQHRLEEIQNSLLVQPQRWEEILTSHLEKHAEAIAARRAEDIERSMDNLRQNVVRQMTGQLTQIQEQLVQQTRHSVEDAAQENLGRVRKELARLVREVAEAMLHQVDSISQV